MRETLFKLRNQLIPIYGKGETEAIIRIIFHHLKGWNITDILIHQEDILSPFTKREIDDILLRLLKHEPIQYITGEARFHGMQMKVKPGVLIPRPETEELVDLIIDENKDQNDLRVMDCCSGSGCIAIALSRGLPFSKVTAVDISPVAIEVMKRNADLLKSKINILHRDIFKWEPKEQFDIIVSNPPYVMDKEIFQMEKNVVDYEPHEALFVRDEDPLLFYDRITDIARQVLVDNGRLYFEINPLTADALKKMMVFKGFLDVTIVKDFSGKNRFVSCFFKS